MPSAPLSRIAWASISFPLCSIRHLRRKDGDLKFRIVCGGTTGGTLEWISPTLLEVQWARDTTLLDDAATEFKEKMAWEGWPPDR